MPCLWRAFDEGSESRLFLLIRHVEKSFGEGIVTFDQYIFLLMLNQPSDMSLSECIAYSGLLCNQLLNVVNVSRAFARLFAGMRLALFDSGLALVYRDCRLDH